MLPTLNMSGDVVIAEHVSHRLGKVGPGDLVLVRSPVDPKKIVTKRVLGMEGDKVTYSVDPNFSFRSRTAVVSFALSLGFAVEAAQLMFGLVWFVPHVQSMTFIKFRDIRKRFGGHCLKLVEFIRFTLRLASEG